MEKSAIFGKKCLPAPRRPPTSSLLDLKLGFPFARTSIAFEKNPECYDLLVLVRCLELFQEVVGQHLRDVPLGVRKNGFPGFLREGGQAG